MARCGCSDVCACLVIAGTHIVVTGNGSAATPFVINGDALNVQDENVTLSLDVTQMDFQGAGVTAALTGPNEVTVTIPGYTDEQARDAIGAALVAGTGISIVVNDPGDTITISALPMGGTLDVQNENVTVATAITQMDFQGSGVDATLGTGEVIVTVRGFSTRAVSTTQGLLVTDEVILASNAITLTLPSAAAFVGKRLAIKNVTATTLTISPAAGLIDGAASKVLTVQYSSIDLVTDGTDWWEI